MPLIHQLTKLFYLRINDTHAWIKLYQSFQNYFPHSFHIFYKVYQTPHWQYWLLSNPGHWSYEAAQFTQYHFTWNVFQKLILFINWRMTRTFDRPKMGWHNKKTIPCTVSVISPVSRKQTLICRTVYTVTPEKLGQELKNNRIFTVKSDSAQNLTLGCGLWLIEMYQFTS